LFSTDGVIFRLYLRHGMVLHLALDSGAVLVGTELGMRKGPLFAPFKLFFFGPEHFRRFFRVDFTQKRSTL